MNQTHDVSTGLLNHTEPASKDIASSTTARQWQVLSQLERGKWIGTTQIHEQIKQAGFDVSLRTIQRDLNALSKRFLLEKNNANPQGWRWRDDTPQHSLPNMNLSQAIAFSMVEANLVQLLPPAILVELLPWFDLARRQLKQNKANKTWLDRVRIEPATQPFIPPEIVYAVKNAIYHAVFTQKRIKASYTKRNTDEAKDYLLNPLAIVQRGVIVYLFATKVEDNEAVIRTFALHRFNHVEILTNQDAITPKGFKLSKHLDDGAMGFNEAAFNQLPNRGKNTHIELLFKADMVQNLIESRLSDDQRVEMLEDGRVKITATVNLTSQLVWWLRGFGKGLLDAKPPLLHEVVTDTLTADAQ